MDAFTRRIIGYGVARAGIDGVAVCRMFNRAIAGQPLPKQISTDHDPLFRFHRWLANLRVLEIDEIKDVRFDVLRSRACGIKPKRLQRLEKLAQSKHVPDDHQTVSQWVDMAIDVDVQSRPNGVEV
jgi:transposase InsO family protein